MSAQQWLYLIVGTVVSFLILEGANLGLLFFEKYRWVQVPCTCKFLELRHNVKGGISGSKITVIAIPKIFISKDFWIQSNSKTSLRQTFTCGLIWIFKMKIPVILPILLPKSIFHLEQILPLEKVPPSKNLRSKQKRKRRHFYQDLATSRWNFQPLIVVSHYLSCQASTVICIRCDQIVPHNTTEIRICDSTLSIHNK